MIIHLNHGQWTTRQQATDTHKHTNKKDSYLGAYGGECHLLTSHTLSYCSRSKLCNFSIEKIVSLVPGIFVAILCDKL